jgi:hypothetical protein
MATKRKPARKAARSRSGSKARKTSTAKRSRAKAKRAKTPRAKSTATTSTRAKAKRGSGKRELIQNASGAHYAKRAADGTFKEMDSRRRSLASDVRTRAKTRSKPGYGDRGDR